MACETVSMGWVSSCDQDGSRCAKGEVCLKFVVKVNVAREMRTDYARMGIGKFGSWFFFMDRCMFACF